MSSELTQNDIVEEYQKQISTQEYTTKAEIEGVELIDLPHFTDDGGVFIEVARLTKGVHDWFHGVSAAQVSYSEMLPGSIKAFHCHFSQEDVWFVPPTCRMLMLLHDLRTGSATSKQTMRLILGGGKAKALLIPRGVAHGVKNIDPNPGFIFYLVSQQFNKDNPDERRLPWDLLGSEIWEPTKG